MSVQAGEGARPPCSPRMRWPWQHRAPVSDQTRTFGVVGREVMQIKCEILRAGERLKITRQAGVNRVAPDESLMLLKPSGVVPHQGGALMQPGERYYEMLRAWIANGVKFDANAPRVTRSYNWT